MQACGKLVTTAPLESVPIVSCFNCPIYSMLDGACACAAVFRTKNTLTDSHLPQEVPELLLAVIGSSQSALCPENRGARR